MINFLSNTLISSLPQASARESPVCPFSAPSFDTLNLLAPWDIPITCELKGAEKQQIEQSLRSLLTALQNPDLTQAQTQITQALNQLPQPETTPAQVITTKTALTPAAINDYDTYFCTTHVQASTPTDTALCLTHGLLANCHKFITLRLSTPTLNPQHIQQQTQGFTAYIHLLSRTFNLPQLS
ncbi:MAG: hypothetical protein AAFR58_06365 [Cyanobacteria bacterium J06627_28]